MPMHHGLTLHVLWWMALDAGHADGRDAGLLSCLALYRRAVACSDRIGTGAGICSGISFASRLLDPDSRAQIRQLANSTSQ